jgi:hypothetical protein
MDAVFEATAEIPQTRLTAPVGLFHLAMGKKQDPAVADASGAVVFLQLS